MRFAQMLLNTALPNGHPLIQGAGQAPMAQPQNTPTQPEQASGSVMPLSSLLQTNSPMNQAPTVNGRLQPQQPLDMFGQRKSSIGAFF